MVLGSPNSSYWSMSPRLVPKNQHCSCKLLIISGHSVPSLQEHFYPLAWIWISNSGFSIVMFKFHKPITNFHWSQWNLQVWGFGLVVFREDCALHTDSGLCELCPPNNLVNRNKFQINYYTKVYTACRWWTCFSAGASAGTAMSDDQVQVLCEHLTHVCHQHL